MREIRMLIECPDCKGTGVYSGMGESKNTAVVCNRCKGTGKYEYVYTYNEFTGRKKNDLIKRVYLKGYGYKIGLGKIDFKGIGEIDMDKEGVSYEDFLNDKMPKHIQRLGCPMLADQGACHSIEGFINRCNAFNGGWLSLITDCKNKHNSCECWELFEEGIKQSK